MPEKYVSIGLPPVARFEPDQLAASSSFKSRLIWRSLFSEFLGKRLLGGEAETVVARVSPKPSVNPLRTITQVRLPIHGVLGPEPTGFGRWIERFANCVAAHGAEDP